MRGHKGFVTILALVTFVLGARAAGQSGGAVAASGFGSAQQAEHSILEHPRLDQGDSPGFFSAIKGFLPMGAGSTKSWLDFGAVPVGQRSLVGKVQPIDYLGRIIGIATVGDFTETDSCGSVEAFSGCDISVEFDPRQTGFSQGELIIITTFDGNVTKENAVKVYTAYLFGYGTGPQMPVYIGTAVVGAAVADPVPLPPGVNVAHCIASPTNAEAPTLTGVYVEVLAKGGAVVLHHSAAVSAIFDIYCTTPPVATPESQPGSALAIPVWVIGMGD